MNHLSHYLSLIGIFTAGIIGIYFFSYDRVFQMGIVIAIAASYVVWGIIHHWLHKDLYFSVVVEYLVIAALGVILVFSLIFRV